MKIFNYTIKNINQLKAFLWSPKIHLNAKKAKSILVQVFSSQTDQAWIEKITHAIEVKLPTAILVGSTTAGEIVEGRLQIGKTVVSISFFETASIKPIFMSCSSGEEFKCGQYLSQTIDEPGSDIAGVLLLATPLSMNVANLVRGFSQKPHNYPMFGGGAGVYTLLNNSIQNNSMIFCGENHFRCGVIAVVFIGKDLHICSYTDLGWYPLSKEMTITEADGKIVKKIDGVSAFEIYQRYLKIKNDKDFFLNVLQFPFLLERNGQTIARVPLFVEQNGSMEFIADLNEGEKFRIGYGDPETIIQNVKAIEKEVNHFAPDAIFVFNCICHRFLMQNEVNIETQLFNAISPTVGFYTYGEFCGNNNGIQVQNSTMVLVGMREGEKSKKENKIHNAWIDHAENSAFMDPYANRHNFIVSRLVHFISVVTSELEQANEELTRISEIDKLTQVCNRLKLDRIFEYEIKKCELSHSEFAVIMMDIDQFKQVNDYYGHNVGDDVLVQITDIIKKNIRETDNVGRWGGEEFLLILPQTNLKEAGIVAEKIRVAIDLFQFPVTKHQTCSLGVTSYALGDSQDKMMLRADKALYEAKNSGRNKVILKSPISNDPLT